MLTTTAAHQFGIDGDDNYGHVDGEPCHEYEPEPTESTEPITVGVYVNRVVDPDSTSAVYLCRTCASHFRKLAWEKDSTMFPCESCGAH